MRGTSGDMRRIGAYLPRPASAKREPGDAGILPYRSCAAHLSIAAFDRQYGAPAWMVMHWSPRPRMLIYAAASAAAAAAASPLPPLAADVSSPTIKW